jgi:hypothetical protein
MSFQSTVRRNFTTGFPGEIVRDGPTRAKPGRISSVSVGVDPGASTNRISRAFGWAADIPATGTTQSAMESQVAVGGAVFFGVLGHPKHYALTGTLAGGPLAASMDLPQYALGEFFDMATGLIAEMFNDTTGAKTMNFGDQVAYVKNTITALENPLALPYGALISLAPGAAAPAGFAIIPNARVINPETMSASALGALVVGYNVIQLTQ